MSLVMYSKFDSACSYVGAHQQGQVGTCLSTLVYSNYQFPKLMNEGGSSSATPLLFILDFFFFFCCS